MNITRILEIICYFLLILFHKSSMTTDCDNQLIQSENQDLSVVFCVETNMNVKSPDNLGLSSNYSYFQITIYNKNFTHLIEPIFENFSINVLDLSFNNIRFISRQTFSKIRDMYNVNLKNNQIESKLIYDLYIPLILTDGQPKTYVEFSSNELNQIDGIFGDDYRLLASLQLSAAKISFIRDYAFVCLNNLRILTLSLNEIDHINECIFSGLINLEILDLDKNRLRIIGLQTFAFLTKISTLSLSSNYLELIETSAFSSNNSQLVKLILDNNRFYNCSQIGLDNLISVIDLNLHGNYLKNSPECNDMIGKLVSIDTLYLMFNQFDSMEFVIKLESLDTLDISYLSLSSFELNKYFNSLGNLKTLYMDYNRIEKLDFKEKGILNNLNFISICNNKITSIEDEFFRHMPNLKSIRLRYNLILDLSEKVFGGLRILTNLDLNNNLISKLNRWTFFDLKSLISLDISHNRIKKIESGAFDGLSRLSILDLSENKIETIKLEYFKSLKSLKNLNLSSNLIISIETGSFVNLVKLTTLDMSRNSLIELGDKLFADEARFIFLSLVHNDLKKIGAKTLITLRPLSTSLDSTVDLSQNSIKSFEDLEYSLSQVQILKLCDNEFENVSIRYANDYLKVITLKSNKIRYFHVESHLSSVVELDLSQNNITFLSRSSFEKLTQLKNLYLSDNPIKTIEYDFFRIFTLDVLKLSNTSLDYIDCEILPLNLTDIDLSNRPIGRLSAIDNVKKLNLSRTCLNRTHLEYFTLIIGSDFELIDLSFNQNITLYFNLNVLQSAKRLIALYLKSIGLQSLDSIELKFMTLNILDLSQNNISRLESKSFMACTRLTWLDLSENSIEYIEDSLFNTLTKLNYLNLKQNFLKIFNFKYFPQLKDIILDLNPIQIYQTYINALSCLETINFSFNKIEIINFRELFLSNIGIQSINLAHGNVSYIIESSFLNMYYLIWLDLSFNQLSDIKPKTFINLRSLHHLNLAFNKLTSSLHQNLFVFQFQLTYLNLSNNYIEYFTDGIFDSLFNLQTLDLSSNKLRIIQNNLFDSFGQIIYMDLSDNLDILLADGSLLGLKSVKDILFSYKQITNNEINILGSMNVQEVKNVSYITYYRSIYVNFKTDDKINCILTLKFIKFNLQINLKTDYEYSLFLKKCFKIDLIYTLI